MTKTLVKTAVIVNDYDEALEFYVQKLGFLCTEDTDLGGGKRWVTVKPSGARGAQLLLARAVTDEQRSRVGNQTGGRVFLFIETDDLARDIEVYRARGVRFVRELQEQPWGRVAVIEDLYGNKLDLIEPKHPAQIRPGMIGEESTVETSRIRDYHAHIYFNPNTVDIARQVRDAIGDGFSVQKGNWNEKQVGPHPQWSAEIIFETAVFPELVPWLALNRRGLSVLVHPNTGDDLVDHRDHALWLGDKLDLALDIFS